MVSKDALKDLLHQSGLGRLDQLLICLGTDDAKPKSASAIRDLAVDSGLRAARGWNVSDVLGKSGGKAVRTGGGWELTSAGKKHILGIAGVTPGQPQKLAATLRSATAKIGEAQTRAFVEEAVLCFEHGLLRAAVVFSWIGAVSVLYDYVLANHLSAFNAEALKRDPKWKQAKTRDDLARMKEHDFLQICEMISMIGKNVKTELESALKLRNACGHPSSLQIGENRAAAHIEVLILNVFAVFP